MKTINIQIANDEELCEFDAPLYHGASVLEFAQYIHDLIKRDIHERHLSSGN